MQLQLALSLKWSNVPERKLLLSAVSVSGQNLFQFSSRISSIFSFPIKNILWTFNFLSLVDLMDFLFIFYYSILYNLYHNIFNKKGKLLHRKMKRVKVSLELYPCYLGSFWKSAIFSALFCILLRKTLNRNGYGI